MNIWHHELIDSRSVRARFFLSLLWSLPLLFGIWLLQRSTALVAILGVVYCYWSAIGVVIDCWRLNHRDASKEREQRLRLFAILPVLLGIPVAIYLFT